MSRQQVTTSLVVRVIAGGRKGDRIVLHDLRSRQVNEFRSWEEALAHMRALSERSGLR
ncbi:MAG TPA: hypothetical protein VFD39_11240 [Trueperaceae bacterium]|nr:hypothetical protein [Trueperaceae bacterium]